MCHMQYPIATTLDHLKLVLETFHKPTRVPVDKVVRYVVDPCLSRAQKAIKATQPTLSYLFHPFLEFTLANSFADLTIKE
jgi:hypothetical protein